MVIFVASGAVLLAAIQARVTISLSDSAAFVADGPLRPVQTVNLASITQVVLRPINRQGVNVVLVGTDRELRFGGLLSADQRMFLARLLLARVRLAQGQ